MAKLAASSSGLSEQVRGKITAELLGNLADTLDLHSHYKLAHWNVKGPHFAPLHELFEKVATALIEFSDELAERAVALGAHSLGTVRQVAKASRLAEYPVETTRDVEHVQHLLDRTNAYLKGLRASQKVADELGDTETTDMLTEAIATYEKFGWFLNATLQR